MSSLLLLLREAMERGDILLSTLQADIRPAALAAVALPHDVTATIWNGPTGTWHQHFAAVLDEQAIEVILELNGKKAQPIV